MLWVPCIAWGFLQIFSHGWYLKCKSKCMEELSKTFSISFDRRFWGSCFCEGYLSFTIRIYFLPVVSNIYLIFAAFVNISVSKFTCFNTCRSKYKKSLNLVALNSTLKIFDKIVKFSWLTIYLPLTPYQTLNTERTTNSKVK